MELAVRFVVFGIPSVRRKYGNHMRNFLYKWGWNCLVPIRYGNCIFTRRIPDSTCGEGFDKVEWYLAPTMNLQRGKFIPKKDDLQYNR